MAVQGARPGPPELDGEQQEADASKQVHRITSGALANIRTYREGFPNEPVPAGDPIGVRRISMAKVDPFHSKKPGTDKHHNNDSCTEGNNIESYNKVDGDGGLPLCDHCKRLS
jgi:hypothetical protein